MDKNIIFKVKQLFQSLGKEFAQVNQEYRGITLAFCINMWHI